MRDKHGRKDSTCAVIGRGVVLVLGAVVVLEARGVCPPFCFVSI